MKLLSLTLTLFRQHIDTSVIFPDGLTGVIGTNGSGKTTLVEAIGFALFGAKALRGKAEDVRTKNAASKKSRSKVDNEPRVVLTLDHGGTIYRIERTLSDAKLFVGGEAIPVSSGTREVSSRIGVIIGMSHDEFVATYCTEQKGLEFLSGKKGATEREKFIIRMMGYDRLEEMQELVREDRKEKRAILLGSEASIGDKGEIETRLIKEREEYLVERKSHDDAVQTLQKTEGDFSQLHEQLRALDAVRVRYEAQRNEVQMIAVRIEERTKRLERISEELNVLRGAHQGEFPEPQLLQKKITLLDENIQEMKAALQAITEQEQASEISWRESIARVRSQKESKAIALETLRQKVRKFTRLPKGSECPTCGREIDGSVEQVKTHFAEEEGAILAELELIEKSVSEAQLLPLELRDLRTKKAELRLQFEALLKAYDESKSEERSLLRFSQLMLDQGALKGEIVTAQELHTAAFDRITSLRYAEQEFISLKTAHDTLQRLVEVARLQRMKCQGELEKKQAMVTRSEEEIRRYEDKRALLDGLRGEVRTLDECDKILTDFRRHVNSLIRPRLAELACEYLTDLTDGRYTTVELMDDFTPSVLEDGEAKAIMSGGEEDILNVCMRLSLSHMLAERAGQQFSLLLLDEIFGSLDEGRRGNVLGLLEKLRKRFEQILIITHLDDVKDGVQNIIQVEYDDSTGCSAVTSQEGLAEYDASVGNM